MDKLRTTHLLAQLGSPVYLSHYQAIVALTPQVASAARSANEPSPIY